MSEVPRASDQHHTPFSGCRWESAEHHRRNGGGGGSQEVGSREGAAQWSQACDGSQRREGPDGGA